MRSLLLLLVLMTVALGIVNVLEAQEDARLANLERIEADFYRAWSE